MATEKDHLPPQTLFPRALNDESIEFFTFPACRACNGSSSDEDFLLSARITITLNQESYGRGVDPFDPDLLALHEQFVTQPENPDKGCHRLRLLARHLPYKVGAAMGAIKLGDSLVLKTLTKIVKSLFWLHSGGVILQDTNPDWWIKDRVDTSAPAFIEHIQIKTHVDVDWGDRFVARYTVGQPGSGADGLIVASLTFYSELKFGSGISWFVLAAPSDTYIDGRSLYDLARDKRVLRESGQ